MPNFEQVDTETITRRFTTLDSDASPVALTTARVIARKNRADADDAADAVIFTTASGGIVEDDLPGGVFEWVVTAGDLTLGQWYWHAELTLTDASIRTPESMAGTIRVQRPTGDNDGTTVSIGAAHISNTTVHVPTGGTDGQVLTWQAGGTTDWETPAAGGGGAGTVTAVTGTAPITSTEGTTPDIGISAATTGAAGSMSAADKTKLDAIESAATADQTGAEIKTAYEAEADTNAYDDAAVAKLAGIESGATADQSAAEVAITDTLALYTSTNVEDALEEVRQVADAAAGGGISIEQVQDDLGNSSLVAGTSLTKTYNDAAGTITLDVDAGDFATAAQGATADTALQSGAIGTTVQAWAAVLDATTASFTTADETKLDAIESAATADQTGAEIKTAYEANADTNAFTDAEQTKLAGVETGATADQTATDVGITDAGGYYVGSTVEAALQEAGADLATAIDTDTFASLTAEPAATDDFIVYDQTASAWKKVDYSYLRADETVAIGVALSDETTAITTGTAKVTVRAPYAFDLTDVRASLTTVSSSGVVTVDINETGTTILSTKLTIDASEKTSTTAAAPVIITDASIADDAEITFDIDTAGTGAKGLKVWLIGTKATA